MSTPPSPPKKSAESPTGDFPKSVTKRIIWPPKYKSSSHGDDNEDASTSNTTSNIETNIGTENLNSIAENHDQPSHSVELDENTLTSDNLGENIEARIGFLSMWSFEACEMATRFAYNRSITIKTHDDYIAENRVIDRPNSEGAPIVKRDYFGREIEVNDNWLINFKEFRLEHGYD